MTSDDGHKSHGKSQIPDRCRQTDPTPPDEISFTTGINPTPPDHSDRLHRPHNPWVVGSIPTGPTN